MLSHVESNLVRDLCRHQLTSTKKDRRVIRWYHWLVINDDGYFYGYYMVNIWPDHSPTRQTGRPACHLLAASKSGKADRRGCRFETSPYQRPEPTAQVYRRMGRIRAVWVWSSIRPGILYTSTLAIFRGIVSENTQISFMPVSCSRCTYIPKKWSIHRPHCTWSNSKDCLKFDCYLTDHADWAKCYKITNLKECHLRQWFPIL